MSDKLASLADKEAAEKKNREEKKRQAREERMQKLVPLSALIVANIIFASLDIRAYQAILIITSSPLLAGLTVLISGGLAMYWFDVLFPHSKKHNNEDQTTLAIWSTVLAIGLSGVLAFADYIVGTGTEFSPAWQTVLWLCVVGLTIYQGVAIARWWMIDNHIASEAKRQKIYAETIDKEDEVSAMRAKLKNLRGFLDELNGLNRDYSPQAVKRVAELLGVPLPDEDKDGIPDYRDSVDNRTGKSFQQRPAYAEDTERAKLKQENPTNPPKQNQ